VTYSAASDVTTSGGTTPISGNTISLNIAITLPPPASGIDVPPNVVVPSDYSSNGFWGGWNGTDRLRDIGGMPADWLVGSNVYRTMLVNQPGVANVSTDVFYGSAPRLNLRYEAMSISGGPLPPWLFFDPNLLRFSGTPPEGSEGTYDFRVIATDRHGRQATADVHIIVLREPANLLTFLRPPPAEEAPTILPPEAPPAEAPAVIDAQPQPAAPATEGAAPTPPVSPPPAAAPAPAPGDGAWLQMPVPVEPQASPDFGLSPQLREHAQAGRMAQARALLDALAT
jgi:Putative Ig domain